MKLGPMDMPEDKIMREEHRYRERLREELKALEVRLPKASASERDALEQRRAQLKSEIEEVSSRLPF